MPPSEPGTGSDGNFQKERHYEKGDWKAIVAGNSRIVDAHALYGFES